MNKKYFIGCVSIIRGRRFTHSSKALNEPSDSANMKRTLKCRIYFSMEFALDLLTWKHDR